MRASDTTIGLHRRLPVTGIFAAALALCGCLAAGCGGGSADPQVASLATAAASQLATSSTRDNSPAGSQTYSSCMRANGVPKFPDPNSDGGIGIDSSSGINPDSPQFKAAEKACEKLSPKGGKPPSTAELAKEREQQLKVSACMRTHGVPKYPDPVFSDGGRRVDLRLDPKSGVDPNSAIFQAAQKTCQNGRSGPPPTSGNSKGVRNR